MVVQSRLCTASELGMFLPGERRLWSRCLALITMMRLHKYASLPPHLVVVIRTVSQARQDGIRIESRSYSWLGSECNVHVPASERSSAYYAMEFFNDMQLLLRSLSERYTVKRLRGLAELALIENLRIRRQDWKRR